MKLALTLMVLTLGLTGCQSFNENIVSNEYKKRTVANSSGAELLDELDGKRFCISNLQSKPCVEFGGLRIFDFRRGGPDPSMFLNYALVDNKVLAVRGGELTTLFKVTRNNSQEIILLDAVEFGVGRYTPEN